MASGSLPATLKIHKHYVRGAELANVLRDKLFPSKESQEKEYRVLYAHTEDLPDSLINYPYKLENLAPEDERAFDQTAKADAGKLPLTLVPLEAIEDIAEIRRYGCMKYKDPDNWKRVEVERYRDALFRHLIAYLRDPQGVDEESGLEHYKHLITNAAFICALERKAKNGKKM